MLKLFIATTFLVSICGVARADELASDIDMALEKDDVGASVVFNPPLFDNGYPFLALTADENPYPSTISYSQMKILAERANSVCVSLGAIKATGLALDYSFDPNGTYLAFSYEGISIVDKFFPKTRYTPGVGMTAVPPAFIKKLTCN